MRNNFFIAFIFGNVVAFHVFYSLIVKGWLKALSEMNSIKNITKNLSNYLWNLMSYFIKSRCIHNVYWNLKRVYLTRIVRKCVVLTQSNYWDKLEFELYQQVFKNEYSKYSFGSIIYAKSPEILEKILFCRSVGQNFLGQHLMKKMERMERSFYRLNVEKISEFIFLYWLTKSSPGGWK